MTLVFAALTLCAFPVLLASLYLALLAALARRPSAHAAATPSAKFDIVVPAHDEAAVIERTVGSLLALAYPRALYRLRVVADNCTDATATLAEAAGAEVLVRTDRERRGKGYALAHAFERSLAEGFADAVVVIDADTVVKPNLLASFDDALRSGASAIQAEYGVLNQGASWRTRLMTIAFTTFHLVRSSARERLGLSAGLRGNGMCFTLAVLRAVPHDAFSVVEDLEYGIRLGEAGHRVWYRGDAEVRGEMAASEQASRSQRQRWGRGALGHGPHPLPAARRPRPARAQPGAGRSRAGSPRAAAHHPGAGRGRWLARGPRARLLAPREPGARGRLADALGLGRPWRGLLSVPGWKLSGVAASALLWAPVYIVWKLGLILRRSNARRGQWVRTTREEKPS